MQKHQVRARSYIGNRMVSLKLETLRLETGIAAIDEE